MNERVQRNAPSGSEFADLAKAVFSERLRTPLKEIATTEPRIYFASFPERSLRAGPPSLQKAMKDQPEWESAPAQVLLGALNDVSGGNTLTRGPTWRRRAHIAILTAYRRYSDAVKGIEASTSTINSAPTSEHSAPSTKKADTQSGNDAPKEPGITNGGIGAQTDHSKSTKSLNAQALIVLGQFFRKYARRLQRHMLLPISVEERLPKS